MECHDCQIPNQMLNRVLISNMEGTVKEGVLLEK